MLARRVNRPSYLNNIIGESTPLRKIHELIEKVAPTRASVLLVGETGTGKELIARAIHDRSRRRDHPFIAANCSAVTDTLWESPAPGRHGAVLDIGVIIRSACDSCEIPIVIDDRIGNRVF